MAKASWEQREKNMPHLWLDFSQETGLVEEMFCAWFGGWRPLWFLSGQLQYYLECAVCTSDGTTGNYREISVFHCQAF